jgi:tetratricopeptide (TPR) repeat protein
VWVATGARSRFGVDVTHHARTGLVGRGRELTLLREGFDRARHERIPQLVTLIGVPGIGKSRLVYELQKIVDADPELVTWRQGRCLAYGDGVAFWALAEVVKAQAGILEQDSEEDAEEKLHAAVADAIADEKDARWVESHLRPLVGLEADTGLGGDRRGEAFAAWRRFLEALADKRPLVLVFEDLHWADEGLLDFVDELVDWLSDVPLLVVSSARPELLERRPGWGGGKLNASTISLSPLSSDETAVLLSYALERTLLRAETQQTLLERAEGNPLYAEQFAQLYLERGSAEDLPLPETLQGIVAARLDGLSAEEKAVLQDASVVGKIFWTGSLRRDEILTTPLLHSLERKGFLTRQRRSSLDREDEWGFSHMLLRDVAYGQIPRSERSQKHRGTAQWIESLGRSEDHAELLAFHWRSALELARASGDGTDDLETPVRQSFREAGDRAFALNTFGVAASHYEEALELWPDDGERADVLFRYARALHWAYDEARQFEALAAARDALLGAGDSDRAAEAEAFLARAYWDRGEGDVVREHLARATELAGSARSAETARVLAFSARIREIAGEVAEAEATAERALAIADELGLDELRAHALTTIGMAKCDQDDFSGIADMERGLEIALAAGSPVAAPIVNNLGVYALIAGDFARTEEHYAEAVRLAERYGDRSSVRFTGANQIWMDVMRGRWEEGLARAEAFIAKCEAGSPHTNEGLARGTRAVVRMARGDPEGALEDLKRNVELARVVGNPFMLGGALSLLAEALAERGELGEARTLMVEVVRLVREHGAHGGLTAVAPYAERLGIRDELAAAIEVAPGPMQPRWRKVVALMLDGDLRGAADLHAEMGSPTLEAEDRLHAGRRFLELGLRADAEVELERALAFYRSVDATAYIAEIEALLAGAQSESA